MKNRKRIIVAFLLVVALVLGVGYAALTDVLNINGDAEVSQSAAETAFDADIYFVDVSEGDDYTAEILSDPDKAYFTVTGLQGKDDTVTITFTVQNDNDVDATIAVNTTNTTGASNKEYFSCTTNVSNGELNLPAGGTAEITVTVTLLKTPVLAENAIISSNFSLEYDVVSVGESIALE